MQPGAKDWKGPGPADPVYQDTDGRKAIRILNPCTGDSAAFAENCQWYDDSANMLAMNRPRWYSTAEALADGTVVLIGGMVHGGFINRFVPIARPSLSIHLRCCRSRQTPATDPQTQHGLAENTFEFYPARRGATPQLLDFLVKTGGLNTYAHAFLLKSGKMFLQANVSTGAAHAMVACFTLTSV